MSSPLLQEKLDRLRRLKQLQEQAAKGKRIAEAESVFERLEFVPNPGPQTRFLELPDENLDVLYGGAAGGGKSHGLLMYALRACMRYPGLQAFWFRKSFPELEQSVLRLLSMRYNYAAVLGARWNDGKHELRFGNDSVLTFAHAKNEIEANALRSAEINLLILDERTTIPPRVVDLLYPRIRSGAAGVPCLGIRSATNPGGPGHGRVRSEYVEATSYGKQELIDKFGRRRIFIQAYVTDTPQLGEEYRRSLEGLPEELRKAFLEGNWSTFEGQMFRELKRERHVVAPLDLPDSWRRYAGVDWGWAKPWGVLWGAVDEDGRVWIYRERYAAGVKETDQAQQILDAETAAGEDVTARYADDAMWIARGEAKSIAEMYEEAGCTLTKASKGPGSRIAGWQRIHSYLAEAPACLLHRAQGWETCPKLHIFDHCTNFYRELENLPYKEGTEDADTDADDHLADCARYLLTNIGNEPRWHFMDPTKNGAVEFDIHHAPQPVHMIGGFPIMEAGGPWEY